MAGIFQFTASEFRDAIDRKAVKGQPATNEHTGIQFLKHQAEIAIKQSLYLHANPIPGIDPPSKSIIICGFNSATPSDLDRMHKLLELDGWIVTRIGTATLKATTPE